jgi:hypothetical protein
MVKNTNSNNKKSEEGIFLSKDKINMISIFACLVFIVAVFSIYLIGFDVGTKDALNRFGFSISGVENYPVSGRAYLPPEVGPVYDSPVAECIIFSDEVYISEIDCSFPDDCAPNGICLMEYNKCAFFII